MPRDERRAVVEGDALAEVKGVGQPVLRNLPAFRKARLDARVGCEADESIEEISDRAPRRHVGRERWIERSRIVEIARVDERPASGSGLTAAACEDERKCEQQEPAHWSGA